MMRTRAIFGGFALVALALLGLVASKELVLARGTLVLLELAPVDPRSLMQGDYMRLDYAVSRAARPLSSFSVSEEDGTAEEGKKNRTAEDGRLVLRLDEQGVGTFVRLDNGAPLGPGELLLRYKVRHDRVRLGAESFFFQEGFADRYAKAKYGELRVAGDGASVLVGLRDAERHSLGTVQQP